MMNNADGLNNNIFREEFITTGNIDLIPIEDRPGTFTQADMDALTEAWNASRLDCPPTYYYYSSISLYKLFCNYVKSKRMIKRLAKAGKNHYAIYKNENPFKIMGIEFLGHPPNNLKTIYNDQLFKLRLPDNAEPCDSITIQIKPGNKFFTNHE